MTRSILLLALAAVFATGCDRGELPVPAHDPGNVETVQVEMGSDYRNQLFYDLGCNCVVSSNLKTVWDLGFDFAAGRIRLNGARGMAIAASGTTDFSTVSDTTGAQWRHDRSSGHPDSTAFGDAPASGEVYLVDRGYDHLGNHTGFRKIVVHEFSPDSCTVRFAALDGSGEAVLRFGREAGLNQSAFSFNGKAIVEVEPPGEDWDFCFTQYTHLFENPPLPYLVAGVLINTSQTAVAIDVERDFAAISYADIAGYTFSQAGDIIGYGWKEFDFGANHYEVLSHLNYIVRDGQGRHFKLHFVDFYTANGDKGAPKMEVQEL